MNDPILFLRPVIKENIARVIAAHQINDLLLWRAILHRTP